MSDHNHNDIPETRDHWRKIYITVLAIEVVCIVIFYFLTRMYG